MNDLMPRLYRLHVRNRAGREFDVHRVGVSEADVRRKTLLTHSAVIHVTEEPTARLREMLGSVKPKKAEVSHA